MRLWIIVVMLASAPALAQHHHDVDEGDRAAFGAGVMMLAATYQNMLYAGNYEGVVPSLGWSNERFGAGISAAFYRLEENGAAVYGLGDLVVHGQVTIVGDHAARAGVIAAVSVPIGDGIRGLGMGHVMVMPAAFGAWTIDRVELVATAGYSRALGGGDHDHGPWPIVEPMNAEELTWSAGAILAITDEVHAGARVSGGVPFNEGGENRVIGALRGAWGTGRVSTGVEIQAGIAGDPFIVRGVLSTALIF